MAKPSLKSCRVNPGDVFNTYHHTRTCLDEIIDIDEKNFNFFFSLPISLRVTLKLSLRSSFSAKKTLFCFLSKIRFLPWKLSNQYFQLKKQVKVDPETRSYDFLTKTREKNPMCRNIRDLGVTLQNAMISFVFLKWPSDCGHSRTWDFGRVPILKTTYTIMKTCSEVSIWCGFHLTKTIFDTFRHRF